MRAAVATREADGGAEEAGARVEHALLYDLIRAQQQRRRNSSCSRSIVFVVLSVFHCAFGKVKNVRSSSPPSRRLATTPGQRLPQACSKVA
jgi:hypothetical protein